MRRRDGEADLERHVESRRVPKQLNTAQVVEGISARGQQLDDAIQTACGSRNLERCARAQPEAAKTCDEGQEEVLVTAVVGDVEKRVSRGVALRDRSASARCAPPRGGSALPASFSTLQLPGSRAFAAAAVTLEILRDPRPNLPISPGGDTEHPGRLRSCRVRSRNHRTRSQGHASLYSAAAFRSTCTGGYIQREYPRAS